MSGLILAFGLWYLIMTFWFINASVQPGEFKEITSRCGFVIFAIGMLMVVTSWWAFLLDKGMRDTVFEELGSE